MKLFGVLSIGALVAWLCAIALAAFNLNQVAAFFLVAAIIFQVSSELPDLFKEYWRLKFWKNVCKLERIWKR